MSANNLFGFSCFCRQFFFRIFHSTPPTKKKGPSLTLVDGTLGSRDRETLWGLSRELDVKRSTDREPIKETRALGQVNCYVERVSLHSHRHHCCEQTCFETLREKNLKKAYFFTMNVFKVALCLILVSCYPVDLFVANFTATVQENQGRGKNEASMVFCK